MPDFFVFLYRSLCVPVTLEILGAQEGPEDDKIHENELQFSCKSQKASVSVDVHTGGPLGSTGLNPLLPSGPEPSRSCSKTDIESNNRKKKHISVFKG